MKLSSPIRYPRRHPGTSHFGEVGFFTLIGVAAVSLLILFGLYWLTKETLEGLASLAQGV